MREGSFSTALEAFFNYKTSTMYTAINCRIVSIRTELNDQRVDVQPIPRAVKPDGESIDRAIITNVPVIFPASSKAAFTFPIDVGDTVLCVFSQRSLDQFKSASDNTTYTPRDKRKFSIRDAIAIPGLFAFDAAINNPNKRTWTHSTRDTVMVNNIGSGQENEVRLKENGDIEIKTNQDFFAQFNNGTIECNNLTINCQNNFTIDVGNTIDISTNILNVTASGTTTVESPTTNWTGAFNLAGPFTQSGGSGSGTATFNVPIVSNASITVNGADVVADGISLKNHTHDYASGGGTTNPPN